MKKFDSFLAICAWGYLTGALSALALMYLAGDRWWPGTLLLFGPRWLLAPPLFVLVPLVLWRRPKLLTPLLLASAIVVGPFMGLHWTFPKTKTPQAYVVRVLTCNVGGPGFDPLRLTNLIRDLRVDIVTVQECKRDLNVELPPGWHSIHPGGVSIFSRYPIKALPIVTGMHLPDTWPRHCLSPCVVSTPWGEFTFNAIHFPTARYGLENILDAKVGINLKKMHYLMTETQNRSNVSQQVSTEISSQTMPLIVAGDFNMPSESIIYRKHWQNLTNAFSHAGRGYGWTTQNTLLKLPIPLRIDHILTANGATPLSCEIGPDIGSDHLPIIADIAIEPHR